MRQTRAKAGLPPLEIPAEGLHVYADLHLQAERSAEVEAFIAQLKATPAQVNQLIVLGDLFDAWTGPEVWREPVFAPLQEAFQALAARGVRLILVRGNRDVLMRPGDAAAAGAVLADAVLWCGSERVLFSHGDEYCLQDAPYQRLRRLLRNPLLRAGVRCIPAFLRQRLARRLRRHSAEVVARKPLDQVALAPQAVESALTRWHASQAVIGHLHQADLRPLPGGGSLRVLPAWNPGSAPYVPTLAP